MDRWMKGGKEGMNIEHSSNFIISPSVTFSELFPSPSAPPSRGISGAAFPDTPPPTADNNSVPSTSAFLPECQSFGLLPLLLVLLLALGRSFFFGLGLTLGGVALVGVALPGEICTLLLWGSGMGMFL